MSLALDILWILLGLTSLYYGAEWLIDAATELAKKLGVSDLVIGLTVLAFGTSAPELVVCLQSALTGTAGLALGNIVGSNICNLALVLAISLCVTTLPVSKLIIQRDYGFLLLSTLLFMWFLITGNELSHLEGWLLLLLLAIYMVILFVSERKHPSLEVIEAIEIEDDILSLHPPRSALKSSFFILLGLTLLIVGGKWLVKGAVDIATALHVSETIIGISVIAIGTSVPEMAACLVAIKKKKLNFVIGNVIGSNIFNLLSVLSVTAIVVPLQNSGISLLSFILLPALVVVLVIASLRYKIPRLLGYIFVSIYVAYIYLEFAN